MRNVKTETFSLDIPDVFEAVRPMWESIRAEHETGDDTVMISAGLADQTHLRKHPGATLIDRFRAFCADRRGPATFTSDRPIQVGDHAGHVITANAETGYAFYFAIVPIEGGYHYELTGDCLVSQQDTYFPLFEQTLLTLRCFGDPVPALAAQRRAIDAMFADDDEEEDEDDIVAELAPPFEIPQDGQDYLFVDATRFDILADTACSVHTYSDTGDGLTLDLKARAIGYDAQACAHILNDYQDGEVYLRFTMKGIYHPDAPTGRYAIVNDSEASYTVSVWKGGFHYSLSLHGELVLKDGWAGFSGYFQGFSSDKRYPVGFGLRLPVADIDWSHYAFGSLEELLRAPADLPRHAQLTDPGPLPDALYRYRALETLTLRYTTPEAAQALPAIPDALSGLTRLRSLALTGIEAVTTLADSLGALTELQWLFITGSRAAKVPDGLLALPKLVHCTLSDNALQSLPEAGYSPVLGSLSLANNQLQTIPAALTQLPNLRTLDLQSNPLSSLPEGLERIENLQLELEKKLALLDYEYRGADGGGTVPVDEAIFLARNDRASKAMLDEALAGPQWQAYRTGLDAIALHAVALCTTDPDDYGTPGNTRFGGLPDLPAGMDYPTLTTYQGETKGWQFIAQLDCAALAPYQDYLPRTGTLYFFIDDQESVGARVLFHEGPASALRSAAGLNVAEDFIGDERGIYRPYRAQAARQASVPHFYSDEGYCTGEAEPLEPLHELFDQTEALRESLSQACDVTPAHAINSYVFKQHDTPQIEAAHRLRGRPEDFMVLLRVSSDERPGFCFWDAGEIYFVIHKSDLAKRDFSNVHCGLESS